MLIAVVATHVIARCDNFQDARRVVQQWAICQSFQEEISSMAFWMQKRIERPKNVQSRLSAVPLKPSQP